jgi:hypothetical protein
MKYAALLTFILFSSFARGQVINVVENKSDADVIVFFTSFEWNADAVVYHTRSVHHARNMEGHWYIISSLRRRPDCINIFVVDHAADANLNIFLSDDESKVKLNQRYKNGAWKGKKLSPL